MKFETLSSGKFRFWKRFCIGASLFVFVLVGALMFYHSYAKYRMTTSINIVSGNISYDLADFNMVAMYRQKVDSKGAPVANQYDKITNISELGTAAIYSIDTTKTTCTASGQTLTGSDKVTVTLAANNASLSFTNVKKQGTKCNVYFAAAAKPTTQTPAQMLASLKLSTCSGSPSFSSADTTTRTCLYQGTDDIGSKVTYYFRGNVSNNWVKFGKTGTASGSGTDIWWRIIRINGDGSIRMIYAGTGDSAPKVGDKSNLIDNTYYKYNNSYNNDTYSKYDGSNAKTQVDSWFNSNLNDEYANGSGQIDGSGKFCNDMSGSSSAHGAYTRLYSQKNPSFVCPTSGGIVITAKAALITADEVAFAGGLWNTNNTSYYLNSGSNGYYCTMSPYNFTGGASVFIVYTSGNLSTNDVGSPFGLRPVINLKSNTQFTGKGQAKTPFEVKLS